nr:hypothetical protein [Tanacetum cinerariifolium]
MPKGDGAFWSIVVEEGELVDATGSGATTLAIRAMTLEAGRSTLGCDPLALAGDFTSIENNTGVLETRFDEEAVFVFVFPEDVTGSVNLTLLSLFFGVTTTNLSLELLMLRQGCLLCRSQMIFWSKEVTFISVVCLKGLHA